MSCIESVSYYVGPQTFCPHWHQADLLMFVECGQAELQIGAKQYHVGSPSIVFVCHLENHVFFKMDAEYARYVLYIAPQLAHKEIADGNRLLSLFWNRPENDFHVIDVAGIAAPLKTLFSLLLDEHRNGDFPEGETALLQSILQQISRHAPQFFSDPARPLSDTVRQLQRRFAERPEDHATLDALAQEYFISVSHLTHSFKQTTGYSIGQYRLLCRISAVKKLLIATDLPVGEISDRCGFSDVSNFCRYFRQEVGCTPREFRRKMTGKK